MNTDPHASTAYPPAMLVFGISAISSQPIDYIIPINLLPMEQQVADAKELDQVLQGLWKSSTNFQDNNALILLEEEFQRSLGKFLTNGEQFVLLSNDGASNKLAPRYTGPHLLLPLDQGTSEMTRMIRDLVDDKEQLLAIQRLVPIDIGSAKALKITRKSKGEQVVTGVTGHSGDPWATGSLYFNVQFNDDESEEFPVLFRNCKLTEVVRNYIKNLVKEDQESPFKILLPQLGEEDSKRSRRVNKQLNDYVQYKD